MTGPAGSSSSFWQVAVPVPLRRTFTYAVSDELNPLPGMRVLVPFGRRRLVGYLLEQTDGAADLSFVPKPIVALLDVYPALPDELRSFLIRAADYYMHPVGEVFKTALPPGMDPTYRSGVEKGARVKAKQEAIYYPTEAANVALPQLRKRAPARFGVLDAIVQTPGISRTALRAVHKGLGSHLKRLLTDGLIAQRDQERAPDLFFADEVERDNPPVLTDEQQVAVDAIAKGVGDGVYKGYLLWGITGSGKTEVYLRVARQVLAQGKSVIVLVPEITLTPQLINRYRARFGENLAVVHSGMAESDRFDQWRLLRQGAVQVAVGVRSAIFAPVENLGLIIVDEEHDNSFKQDRGFVYHARDLALLRASRAGAVAVLGSATPSLESYHNAMSGRLQLLTMDRRARQNPLPKVELLDLTVHKSGRGGQRMITFPLEESIEAAVSRGEQVLLFLNRRGFAPCLLCKSCGASIKCDDCAVSLTVHRRPAGLICHYCGKRRPIEVRCPACHQSALEPVGIGTQQVEELVARMFPTARVARLDRDVASAAAAEDLLDRVRRQELDILVGTQMITKGHDFPNVTLVGVIHSDVGLHMPDFRAAERTFQLITQVAGRAGRAELPGMVLVQSFCPTHPAIKSAANHDYLTFAQSELVTRRELSYPPFGKLAALKLSSTTESAVEAAARAVTRQLRNAVDSTAKGQVVLLGPAPAPLSFVQNRYRWQILIKARTHGPIRKVIQMIIDTIESPPRGVRIRLDVDPTSML